LTVVAVNVWLAAAKLTLAMALVFAVADAGALAWPAVVVVSATTVNGSNLLTSLSGLNAGSGPFIGAAVSGTGISGGTTISGITYSPSGVVQS
ncbi:hypothetical protein AB9F46_35145, partial [Rhizobium leguminosarum]